LKIEGTGSGECIAEREKSDPGSPEPGAESWWNFIAQKQKELHQTLVQLWLKTQQ